MLWTLTLGLCPVVLNVFVKGDGECPDINGRIISPGLHYVPGPDTCTLCICENGQPKWCKAVLCSPPQDCKSFRLGNTCCEFICLDDALSTHPDSVLDGHQDFGLRLIASAVTVILFLSILFFMVHRLRQRKLRGHQNRQMNEDQRSLTSIGYIGGSLGYLGGDCDDAPVHFPSLWKPPGNYFPRGEAPPPYDEAVAQARAEAISISNMSGFHRSFPLNATTNMENLIRVDNNHSSQPRNRNIAQTNNPAVTQFHNNNSRISAPFYLNNLSTGQLSVGDSIADMRDRQVVVMGNNRARNFTTQHSISSANGNNNFISTLKITSSLAAVTNRGIVSNIREQTECNRNNFLYNTSSQTSGLESMVNNGSSSTQPRALPSSSIEVTRQHRTIPRILSTLEDQTTDNRNFIHMKQRPMIPKINRETNPARIQDETSRHSSSSSSRFSTDSNNPRLVTDNSNKTPNEETRAETTARLSKDNVSRFNNDNTNISRVPNEHVKASNENSRSVNEVTAETRAENDPARPSVVDIARRPSVGSLGRLLERHTLLPMPADTTPCGCSYESEPHSMMNDDQDDYHSECENCKSANGSRYYLDESEEGSELCETMTLHRRPLPEHGSEDLNQLPTSLTLPVKTKRSRCPPGARDAWFSSMPGTSSSEDD